MYLIFKNNLKEFVMIGSKINYSGGKSSILQVMPVKILRQHVFL